MNVVHFDCIFVSNWIIHTFTASHLTEEFCNKFTLNVLISWGVDLDGFDKVGRGVGHLFCGLDKLSPSHRVGGFGRSQAAGVTESWGVLRYNCCCRQDLTKKHQQIRSRVFKIRHSSEVIQVDFKVFKLNEPFNSIHRISISFNSIQVTRHVYTLLSQVQSSYGRVWSRNAFKPRMDLLTCEGLLAGSTKFWQAICIAWWALANWMGSTSPSWPDWLLGSDTPTR